ncbi:MAG: MurR/RpiR family transcriptional regulator [Paenibacillus dendritiformis]|uniref:MurR/RpiR family transcriptional regulator n=1 Tax=uncultured Paenibacillus sp. TaxID=227322 RepID=UPI0025F7E3D7|nr:MurR/RpiR family transcriptional regulator [uncultured Paenibacillus sp.]MDU5141096.1 MurR/RpiR family transcriptional regulator [Paenibacillus dendritiformis]
MRRSQVTGINQSSILRISSIYPSLTKSEKKVADIVLKDPETAVFYTITDLSKQAEVGDTSVIRFCRKLGYSGYQEFKLSLAQNLGTVEEQISGALEPGVILYDRLQKTPSKWEMEGYTGKPLDYVGFRAYEGRKSGIVLFAKKRRRQQTEE